APPAQRRGGAFVECAVSGSPKRQALLGLGKCGADGLRLIPASGAEDLETRLQEPLLGRRALEGPQRALARQAPCIRTGGIGIVAPEETDALLSIGCVRDVPANQADALLAVPRAQRSCLPHDEQLQLGPAAPTVQSWTLRGFTDTATGTQF